MSFNARPLAATAAAMFASFLSGDAQAHHAMGGKLPASFMDGFLSGLAHPILGPDHMAFVVGIGLLAAIGGFGVMLPALFVAAMVGGLALHFAGANVPYSEILLALSVVAIGCAIVLGRERPMPLTVAGLFGLAGILHGYAFAESIIGAEATPVVAYVGGLALVQFAIAGLTWYLAHPAKGGQPVLKPVAIRALGLTIVAVGAVFLALNTGMAA